MRDDVLAPLALRHQHAIPEYRRARGRVALFHALDECAKWASAENCRPILHLECHGDADGMELADGARASWQELVVALLEINRATRMNLVVVAAMCLGIDLMAVFGDARRAAAWTVIGPQYSIKAGELYEANARFYATLYETSDLGMAIAAMNEGGSPDDLPFREANAEVLLAIGLTRHLESLSPAQRTREVMKRIGRGGRHYLWLDEFPGNEHRFSHNYASIKALREADARGARRLD